MGHRGGGGGPAGAGARALPRRRLRRGAHRQRRPHPARGGDQLPRVRAGGLRLLAAQRRAHPRGGDRRHPRRGRRVPGARGQPPEPLGGQLRAGQPRRHGAGAARAVLGPTHSDGHRLPGPADQRAPARRAGLGAGADGRRAHAGRAQLGLLRARAVGAPHGRAPGGGPRPRLSRYRHLPPHHRGRGARARDLPAHRRRLPRSAAVPARVAGGLPGHRQRGAGRSGDDRQRGGERRGRRQARLHLRARHDPLLPGRGPDPAQRRDDAPGGRRRAQGRALPPRRPRLQAGRRLGGQGTGDRPVRHGRRARRAGARGGVRPPALDRPAGRRPVHLAHLGRPRHGAAPRRSAPVRGQRRRGHLGPAGRPHPGGPGRGQPGGQLEPGRRLQGHLGRGRRALHARAPAAPGLPAPGGAAHGRRAGRGRRARRAATAATAAGQHAERRRP